MTGLQFICPECRERLDRRDAALSCPNAHSFRIEGGVYRLLPQSLSDMTVQEAEYHGEQRHTWIEQQQMNAFRNVYFHRSFLRSLTRANANLLRVLELGGGVAYDLELFLQIKPSIEDYVFSEISLDLVKHAASIVKTRQVTYCTVEALNLPFADGQFDCVFMVAGLHHVPELDRALEEMSRVTKSGGVIGFGIEPNRWWLKGHAHARGLLRKILPHKTHSAADDETPGLAGRDFRRIEGRHPLKLVQLQPVWFLCGFVHYGLEFLYRLLRLRRRIRLPALAETVLVSTDVGLSHVPILKKLSWHHSVVYQKV